jgi:hypothetical protein
VLGEFVTFVSRGSEAFQRRCGCFLVPRGIPFVNDGWIFQQTVNLRRGWTAEHIHIECPSRPAHERQRHHSIAEMVEFNDEKAGFHVGRIMAR